MEKFISITFRASEKTKNKLDLLAKNSKRSLSNMIILILEDHIGAIEKIPACEKEKWNQNVVVIKNAMPVSALWI